jgi:hypothetical protein
MFITMMITMMMLHLFYPYSCSLFYVVNRKIICLIGTWRTTQENSATTILYGSGLETLACDDLTERARGECVDGI